MTGAGSDPVAANDPAERGSVAGDSEPLAFEHDEITRAREEIMMLAVGFGTGLTIALVFLCFIVLEKLKVFS
jgi:hypothetical protein